MRSFGSTIFINHTEITEQQNEANVMATIIFQNVGRVN